jgi:hypothetical protein
MMISFRFLLVPECAVLRCAANDVVNLVLGFISLGSQLAVSRGRATKVTPLLLSASWQRKLRQTGTPAAE